jgi:hypothetical protein
MGLEETEEFKKFFAMSPEQFDKYMCQTYPDQFEQRGKPMSETCMCWGFCIGKGWYYYLDELCKKLDLIQKLTGIRVSFSQIKEKYGSGRLYNNPKYGFSIWYGVPSKYRLINRTKDICCKVLNKLFYRMSRKKIDVWVNIIDELIHNCESRMGHICEETGKYIDNPIDVGNWIYALSEEGFLIAHPDRKDVLEDWKKYEEEKKKINDAILDLNDDRTEELKKFLKIV